MNKNNNVDTRDVIDLVELFTAILKKWWLVALAGILCAALSLGYTIFFIKPLYQSEAMLYILTKTTTVASFADIQIGNALTSDFEVIATSKPVIDGAIKAIKKEHKQEFTRQEIKSMLSVVNKADTRILQISATSTNPEWACWVSNAIAEETAAKMAEIMVTDPPTTVEEAEVSTTPISPSVAKNTVMGFMLGVILVCGIIVVCFLLNDKFKSEDEIEKELGIPVLVSIPYMKARDNE